MVVIRDIDFTKRSANVFFDKPLEDIMSMSDYLEIAKNCIIHFTNGDLTSRMINDEDAISHVAESLMWGHYRWKPDLEGGRTLYSYLNQCALWGIQIWKTKLYQQSLKPQHFSLNKSVSSDGETQHYQLIPDEKSKEPFDIIFNNVSGKVQTMLSSNSLTEMQSVCLRGRYVGGQTMQEIANDIGVSRQAVEQHIKRGIANLQKEYA